MKLSRMEHIELHGEYPWLPGGRVTRFLIGRPMDNLMRTNATFWRDASSGYPSRWLRLAGWKRSVIRISGVYGVLLCLILLAAWFSGAHAFVLLVSAGHLLPIVSVLFRRHVREHGLRLPVLRREWVEQETGDDERHLRLHWERVVVGRRAWEQETVIPLARALAPLLQVERRPEEARAWITVPHDYMQPGASPVEILLPGSFSGADEKGKTRIERAVAAKLGMLETVAAWQLSGNAPRLLISAPPTPPKSVTYGEVERLLYATTEYRPFLGMVAGGELLAAEMVADSPHIALSAGSGAGKSMMMKAIIMQALHWGWTVIILDWKAASHSWAKGLPGVRYLTTEQAIHDCGVQIGEEVDRRKGQAGPDGSMPDGTPKVLVVREEWNMTATLLMEYWMDLRATAEPEERRTMPMRSPGLIGFQKLDFAGRQFGMFDLLAAQRMSNRVFNGNADMRENFMIRLLARYTAQTWKMLVSEIKFMRKPKELGRWVVVAGDEATIVQGILINDSEAREFAMAGIPNPASPWMVTRGGNVARTQEDQLPGRATTGNSDSPTLDYLEGEEVPLRLAKLSDLAINLEPLGITLKILQHAAGDPDSGFPSAQGGTPFSGYTYDAEAVKMWTRTRHAQIAARRQK